jgi:hypothetical protein
MVWYGMVGYGMGNIKPKKLSNTIPAYKIGARKWLHPSASLEAPTKIFSKFEPNISLSNFFVTLPDMSRLSKEEIKLQNNSDPELKYDVHFVLVSACLTFCPWQKFRLHSIFLPFSTTWLVSASIRIEVCHSKTHI